MKLFDLHCDTLYECCETGKHLRENDLHVNRAAAQKYEHYVAFFALFCGRISAGVAEKETLLPARHAEGRAPRTHAANRADGSFGGETRTG